MHGGHREKSGNKPTCLCGNCRLCVQRSYARRWRARHIKKLEVPPTKYERRSFRIPTKFVSEEELERKLVDYFIEKGWETEEWVRKGNECNLG